MRENLGCICAELQNRSVEPTRSSPVGASSCGPRTSCGLWPGFDVAVNWGRVRGVSCPQLLFLLESLRVPQLTSPLSAAGCLGSSVAVLLQAGSCFQELLRVSWAASGSCSSPRQRKPVPALLHIKAQHPGSRAGGSSASCVRLVRLIIICHFGLEFGS